MTLPGLVRANNLNDVVDRERAWDNLGSSLATGDISIPAPSLDLNFAANKSLVDDISGNNLITFTRDSIGTFVGSNGLIQTAASGVPRFDHNPTTGGSLGLLVEEARINSLLQSSDLTEAGWTLAGFARTANSTTAPDGTNTAVKIASTTGTFGFLERSGVSSPAGVVTYSWYAKAAEANWFAIADIQLGLLVAYFNLATGALGTRAAGTAHTITPVGNGWYRCSVTGSNGLSSRWGCFASNSDNTLTPAPIGNGVHVWGPQLEAGSFPTSYIPTVASEVTRAADVASITGANFSSWYNNTEGTVFTDFRLEADRAGTRWATQIGPTASTGPNSNVIGKVDNNLAYAETRNASATQYSASITFPSSRRARIAYAIKNLSHQAAFNGVLATAGTGTLGTPSDTVLLLGRNVSSTEILCGTIARLTYWPSRLNDKSLPYITQPSVTAINLYAFNYAINGKDVLALNAVRNASTRNFIFIKGLLSAAQPRLTTAAASTSSALTLATNALPKLSPTSSGNYFFASGITLSGVTTRINGTNALSIATSPFSGSTATAPLLFRELRPQANWRFTEPMPSGTIAYPEFAIPFETNDFVLFMKAGPN